MRNREFYKLGVKWLLLSCMVFAIGCTAQKEKEESSPVVELKSGDIAISTDAVSFSSLAESISLGIDSKLSTDQIDIAIHIEAKDQYWCKASIEKDQLIIKVEANNTKDKRYTEVKLSHGSLEESIKVSQDGSQFIEDRLLPVKSVSATNFESVKGNHSPKKMIDGDHLSFFLSKDEAITEWPFNLNFFFEGDEDIDYIKYVSRTDDGDGAGAFGKFELWYATEQTEELIKFGEFDFKMKNDTTSYIDLKGRVKKAKHIQFRILSGLNDRVSCGQMMFYVKAETADDYVHIFADKTCSELRPEITKDSIELMSNLVFKDLALALLEGTYDKTYRVQNYRPYQHPDIMAEQNKIRPYSLRDNPTGIYVKDLDQKLVVFVGDSEAQELSLNIRNYKTNEERTFYLLTGENIITPTIEGLVYIYNHTDRVYPLNPTKKDSVELAKLCPKIHILTGEVNGFFDIKSDNQESWNKLLEEQATYSEIDVLGNHSHVVWCVDQYKENETDIVKMTNYIDRIVNDQKEFMGLYHHNREVNNRLFLHADHKAGAAYAANYRTAYNPKGYGNVFTTEEGLLSRMWVLGHEVGHINQLTPGLKWAGTTEVTNNLLAMYNQQQILGEANRLDNKKDGYEVAFKEIIKGKKPWVLPDNYSIHIPKVAPFWQLKLYFVDVLKQEHFFHDLYEHYRETPDLNEKVLGDDYHGMLQLDFVRVVCNLGKVNLLEFFEEWGFLRPIDGEINDYGLKTLRITQKQIDDLKKEIEACHYPLPTCKVQELTDKNYKSFIK